MRFASRIPKSICCWSYFYPFHVRKIEQRLRGQKDWTRSSRFDSEVTAGEAEEPGLLSRRAGIPERVPSSRLTSAPLRYNPPTLVSAHGSPAILDLKTTRRAHKNDTSTMETVWWSHIV
jgi:hypothetical protein